MSSVIVLTTLEEEIIHGTLAEAQKHIGMTRYAQPYKKWIAAAPDDQKGTLANAVRLLNDQPWDSEAETFALRDAIPAFAKAQYELAAMLLVDPTLATLADQGSNVQSVSASGASVTYFNPTMKNAAALPPLIMRLVGEYLAASTRGPVGGTGSSGSSVSPASSCADFKRRGPY